MVYALLHHCRNYFFILLKYTERKRLLVPSAIMISIVGFVLSAINTGTFTLFKVSCIAQLFMLFGYMFRKKESLLDKQYLLICSFLVFVLLGILSSHFYPGKTMDVHVSRYYNYWICILMILSGLLFVFLVFKRYYMKEGILSFIGKNTLVFYLIGAQAKAVTLKIIKILVPAIPENQIGWCFVCILICFECAIVSIILNHFAPELVGKKQRR